MSNAAEFRHTHNETNHGRTSSPLQPSTKTPKNATPATAHGVHEIELKLSLQRAQNLANAGEFGHRRDSGGSEFLCCFPIDLLCFGAALFRAIQERKCGLSLTSSQPVRRSRERYRPCRPYPLYIRPLLRVVSGSTEKTQSLVCFDSLPPLSHVSASRICRRFSSPTCYARNVSRQAMA
jgi:hypothetical protein